MLGQEIIRFFKKQNVHCDGIARKSATYNLDIINNFEDIKHIILKNKYDLIINAIALVNLEECEKNPQIAYMINADFPYKIIKICENLNTYFVHISTDHYYNNDFKKLHSETDRVELLNEYAKSKYQGEEFIKNYDNVLIIRTNIIGFRRKGNLTFIEWVIDSLNKNKTIIGYEDMFTSSIDVQTFVSILNKVVLNKETGIINIAADGVVSKYDFIYALASKFQKQNLISKGNLKNDTLIRCNSLGLSVGNLKNKYPYIEIPSISNVIDNIYLQYKLINKE